ncbi:MAG: ATP-binding protein [Polyangiaceae bacterium]
MFARLSMTLTRLVLDYNSVSSVPHRPITSPTEFAEIVALGLTTESRTLEFKREYHWTGSTAPDKRSVALELCRDIAQFANTDGGALIVGVAERAEADGTKVADCVVPVPDVDGFVGWVEQSVRNHLIPATFQKLVATIPTDAGQIVAINVPAHVHLVALWPNNERRAIEYLYRTSREKAWMNPDEVEAHLMDGSRAIKLEARRVFDATPAPRNVDLVPPVCERIIRQSAGYVVSETIVPDRDAAPRLKELHHDYLVLTMTPTPLQLHIPYAMVRSIWSTADGHIGIALSTRIFNTKASERQFVLEAL